MPLAPYNRRELFLEAIRTRDTSALPDPNNREELFLKDIADQVAAIPAGIPVSVPAELSELLANLPEPHTHTERFYNDIIGALLVATTVTDTTPYISRETAGGLPVEGSAELKKKLGNTVCVNQLFNPANAQSWTQDGITVSFDSTTKKYTISGTATATIDKYIYGSGVNTVKGHKYAFISGFSGGSGSLGSGYDLYVYGGNFGTYVGMNKIGESTNGGGFSIYLKCQSGVTIPTKTFSIDIPDLTLWFGSNDRIPSDLLSHPENWGRYYAGSLAYNAGTLESADGTVLKSIGRNVWDEEWELGGISTTTGTNYAYNFTIRAKNYIPVIPSQIYYVKAAAVLYFYDIDKNFISYTPKAYKTFSVPADCHYMRFRLGASYGTTYKNDITISLYYPGESGYSEYYPYSVLAEVDTGSEVLRSAGAVADEKTPDGTITRRVGVVDLGTLTWNYDSGNDYMNVSTALPNAVRVQAGSVNVIAGCEYTLVNAEALGSATTKAYTLYDGRPFFKNTGYTDPAAFKTAMSGVYLYYELATPTTEQGTDFDPGYVVEAGGIESWDLNTGVPQGHETEYKEFTT